VQHAGVQERGREKLPDLAVLEDPVAGGGAPVEKLPLVDDAEVLEHEGGNVDDDEHAAHGGRSREP
jgi:hypothetical protein